LADNRAVPSKPRKGIPPDGIPLNECVRDLHAAIAARPMIIDDVVHAHVVMGIPKRPAEERWDAGGAPYRDGRRWPGGPDDLVARAVAAALIEEGIREGRMVTWVILNRVEKRVSGAHIFPDWGNLLATGVYASNEDSVTKLAGHRLYVKQADWRRFVDEVLALRGNAAEPAKDAKPRAARKLPGPSPDPDWPAAIAKVTKDCIAAGYKRPLKRGAKAAIQTQLLNFMAARDKHLSDAIAAKYAEKVIEALPCN
jgi:hypothetical protein